LALLFSLALTACGGGGGGGSSPDNSLVSMADIFPGAQSTGKVPDDFSGTGGVNGAVGSSGTTGDATGETAVTGGSLHVKMADGNGGQVVIGNFETGVSGDVEFYTNGQIAASKPLGSAETDILKAVYEARMDSAHDGPFMGPGEYTDFPVNSPNSPERKFTGTITYNSQYVHLNSKMVGLEHSTFGAWLYDFTVQGKINDVPVDLVDIVYTPLSGGNNRNLAHPAPNNVFSGKATALAVRNAYNEFESAFLTGDASLTINGSATNGNLELDFPEFYNIKYNDLNITGSSMNFVGTPVLTDNGNTTGITITQSKIWNNSTGSPDHDTFVKGSFYGDTTLASEAVGTFSVFDSDDHGVSGAFGVKK
jgi:hypothetical protein